MTLFFKLKAKKSMLTKAFFYLDLPILQKCLPVEALKAFFLIRIGGMKESQNQIIDVPDVRYDVFHSKYFS